MATVLRFLFVIPIGFVLACFAASFALLWPFLDVPADGLSDPFLVFELAAGFIAQAGQVGATALIPWALFMVATELFGLSSILLHILAGLAAGFAAMRLMPGGMPAEPSLQMALMVAGLSFALVYWLATGRSAGRWRRRRAPSAPPATPVAD